jgi:hypothetical protein
MVILINGMPAPGSSGGAPAGETKLWLPTIAGGGGGGTSTYWTQFGIACKQDKVVTAWLEINVDVLGELLGFFVWIAGLPWPISSLHGFHASSNKLGQVNGLDTTFTEVGILAYSPDVDKLRLVGRSSSGTTGYLPPAALIPNLNGITFQGYISYLTD